MTALYFTWKRKINREEVTGNHKGFEVTSSLLCYIADIVRGTILHAHRMNGQ